MSAVTAVAELLYGVDGPDAAVAVLASHGHLVAAADSVITIDGGAVIARYLSRTVIAANRWVVHNADATERATVLAA
ncbi:hypothetical protein [Mycolicibacterium fortuitum]|uniref:hypothetical protein n=1 Tax=Mycolicibacterium fortuitum TaxID=1766 RepID=UPI0007EA809C|nr:hypothetical protein [Mycolicibacterium fortuitum]OBG50466.1 hypothetical protein A5670_25680 [Mycolicibacterium fortuitum]